MLLNEGVTGEQVKKILWSLQKLPGCLMQGLTDTFRAVLQNKSRVYHYGKSLTTVGVK